MARSSFELSSQDWPPARRQPLGACSTKNQRRPGRPTARWPTGLAFVALLASCFVFCFSSGCGLPARLFSKTRIRCDFGLKGGRPLFRAAHRRYLLARVVLAHLPHLIEHLFEV